jgi:hypothetical protein
MRGYNPPIAGCTEKKTNFIKRYINIGYNFEPFFVESYRALTICMP